MKQKLTHVFAKASVCWADEFNCEAFAVFTLAEWAKVKADAKKYFEKSEEEYGECRRGFGTNEELDFADYGDWLGDIEVKKISSEEASLLIKLFSLDETDNTWGTGAGALFEFADELADMEEMEKEELKD